MIRRVLLLQPEFIRRYPSEGRLTLNHWARRVLDALPAPGLGGRLKTRFFNEEKIGITSELNHYGDLPALLGPANVFALERYHPAYYEAEPRGHKFVEWENYPSNFGYPAPSFLSLEEARAQLPTFDAVLASVVCGAEARPLLRAAKGRGVLVALFDNIDHEEAYLSRETDLFRGYAEDEFDVFFKKDIPLEEEDERLIPIAPVPTKKFSVGEAQAASGAKETDLFFVGHYRPGVVRQDRRQLCLLLQERFPGAKILLNAGAISKAEYDKEARRARMLLSPAGRVWCSYRHAEFARFGVPVVMPAPNCKTAGPAFEDGVNCILYRTRRDAGDFVLDDADLVDRITHCLKNDDEAARLGRNLTKTVLEGHTTEKRAAYIVDCLRRAKRGVAPAPAAV